MLKYLTIFVYLVLANNTYPQANGNFMNDKPLVQKDEISEALNLSPLSENDVETYREIFKEQNRGRWKQADRQIAKIENSILLGHVYYQRYMHATAYTSSHNELKNWMTKYADLPVSPRIYELAIKKNGGNASGLSVPITTASYTFPADKPTPPARVAIDDKPIIQQTPQELEIENRKRQERREVANFKAVISRYLRQHQPDRAEKRLWAFVEREILNDLEIDTELSRIANEYYLTNQDEKALALGQFASRSRDHISQSDWIAGLASWRLGNCASAAEHFEHVANSSVAGDWTAAAGAYWAARSNIICRQPAEVTRLLKIAASYHRTFYGIIASRQLGKMPDLNWQEPEFSASDFREVNMLTSVQRGVALAQIGENTLADMELSTAWSRTRDSQHYALLGLASRLGLAATQLKIGKVEEQKSVRALDSTLYPVPYITPEGGYTLDKALLFAMIRQESEFNSWAQSRAGARGLMQLMMGAAGDMSQNRSLRRIRLDDPRYNMSLGQKYMQTMLSDKYAEGNLFKSLTAYNAGPGNMRKWMRQTNFQDDPLLFIESIPARETREYIERVISNMWIYRMRMGQDMPSLEHVAAGEWPIYDPVDNQKSADINNKNNHYANRSN